MPITARVALTASCMLLLPLTACSGGSDEDGDGNTTAAELTMGPLDEYEAKAYGWASDKDTQAKEAAQAEAARQEREVEKLVATCMSEKGFDYTPVEYEGDVVDGGDLDLDVKPDSREFAETYGYGISTDPWVSQDTTPDEPDPNDAYTKSMSESELAAYNEALWGPLADELSDDEGRDWDWTTSGCQGSASHQVFGDEVDLDDFTTLGEEIQRFRETVADDPRLVELKTSWSSCMADAGHDGLTVDTSSTALADEWTALRELNTPEFQALQDSWDWGADPNGPPQPEVDAAAVKEFKAKEIAAAVAEFDCKAKLDYDAFFQKVDHELQQAFVDQHKVELDALVAAATTRA